MTRFVPLDNVRTYLRRTGWTAQPPGPAGALWHHSTDDATRAVVLAVPDEPSDGEIEWRSLVERLAVFEGRSVEEMAQMLRELSVDVTRFRAANDYAISGSIPLTAGVGLVGAAYKMLRASATTAQRPRAHIAGNFSKLADDIANLARLGHTEEGSYVLPVLMPLTNPPSEPPHMWSLEEGVDRVAPEPVERRVTRTLAQALTALQNRIIKPARDPQVADLPPLIAAGACRELVVAVGQIIADPAIATFEAAFQWAPAFTEPSAVPDQVQVPSDAADLLTRAARLLATSKRDPHQTITGPVVEVRHVPGDEFGEMALQTTSRGRPAEVRVRLSEQALDPIHDWMRKSRTVVVEGPIVRVHGKPLRVDDPTNVYPLDETYLSSPKTD